MLELSWQEMLHNLVKLGIAFLLALPLGYNRETSEKHLGLRTFPLVAMTSCGFILIGTSVLSSDEAQSRIIQGLITGIGFLGGGAIVKRGIDVKGTATAAGIWTTAAIGGAVAYSRYEIAISLGVVTFATFRFLPSLKKVIRSDDGDDRLD
ncbi:MAG: MgtC/SapB family protein [Myxococcales bacterium]|jgi:putative Mg2+ transporter-C (MgtC) family protein